MRGLYSYSGIQKQPVLFDCLRSLVPTSTYPQCPHLLLASPRMYQSCPCTDCTAPHTGLIDLFALSTLLLPPFCNAGSKGKGEAAGGSCLYSHLMWRRRLSEMCLFSRGSRTTLPDSAPFLPGWAEWCRHTSGLARRRGMARLGAAQRPPCVVAWCGKSRNGSSERLNVHH